MNRALQQHQPKVPQLDATLALLASVEPRAGLEGRVLTHLCSAPASLPWHQRISVRTWTAACVAGLIVAALVTLPMTHRPTAHNTMATPAIVAAPRPAQRAITAAAATAVPDRPILDESQVAAHPRHRNASRGFRAQHRRVPLLPRGTVAPLHPQMLNPTQ